MYNLLIVDDEVAVLDTLEATIPWSQLGITTVFKAQSAHQALDIARAHPIDIVITDIKMPIMSGLELVQELNVHHEKVHSILLTGYADFEYAQQAISNGVVEYLLKPVSDEELINAVNKVTEKLSLEWENLVTYQRVLKTLHHHKPLLRVNFLNELLQGKNLPREELTEKLNMLEIPLKWNENFCMITVRLEEEFLSDRQSMSLFEFAIGNIAEETFGEHFDVFFGKDSNDYLIFLVKLNSKVEKRLLERNDGSDVQRSLLNETALKLQSNVKRFLKGTISIMVSGWGTFPQDVPAYYQYCLTMIRKRVGKDKEFFITVNQETDPIHFETIQSLYEPPLLIHLLETGQWEAVYEKVDHIFEELRHRWGDSQEHLLEVFFSISAAFVYCAHKNGKHLIDLLDKHFEPILSAHSYRTVEQLQNWCVTVLHLLEDDTTKELKKGRFSMVQQVQRYIEKHLQEDLSLQTIADHVFLHPVYLSKVYKSETGENLSDYLLRTKMEKAAYLIKNTNYKIYEISSKLGYQNPPYFIKVFKRYFGATPQEYRETGSK